MLKRDLRTDDTLEDFVIREITLEGLAKRVYVAGAGPAVIVMAEMPGISPECRAFRPLGAGGGFHCLHAVPIRPRWSRADRGRGWGCVSTGLHQCGIPCVRSKPIKSCDALAPGLGPPCAPGMRRTGCRCDRHVFHRKFRAHDDAGTVDAGARPLPTVASVERPGRASKSLLKKSRRFASGSNGTGPHGSGVSLRGRPEFCMAQRFAA